MRNIYRYIFKLFFFLIFLFLFFPSQTNAMSISGLILNGDFESGHSSWGEYYYSIPNKNLVDWPNIIQNSSTAANGQYKAAVTSSYDYPDALFSNDFVLPQNTSSLKLNFNGLFIKNNYCYYNSDDLFSVSLMDSSTGGELLDSINIYHAQSWPTDTQYWYRTFNFNNISDRSGHNLKIFFTSNQSSYYCYMTLNIDDVKITAIVPDDPAHMPMYRLYNNKNGAYLYTRGENDRDHVRGTWPEFEFSDGVPAFYASTYDLGGQTPIYRLYNTSNGAYLYTRGEADRDHVLNTWHEFEFTDGVPAFYANLSDPGGYTPIYRLYNTKNGMYLYTRGLQDRNHVMNTWPEFEFTDGIPAFYATLN